MVVLGGATGHEGLTTALLLASLQEFHAGWAWFAIIGNGLAGVWALLAGRVPGLRTRALWWFTTFAQLAMALQVVLGVVMVSAQDRQVEQFHMFYGFVAVIAMAIYYSYRQQLRERVYLLYGLGGLFVMGLGIRALLVVNR